MVHVLYKITEWTIDQFIHVKVLCVTVHQNIKKDRDLCMGIKIPCKSRPCNLKIP